MKYTIMHVDNRAKDVMDKNKKILKDYEYVNDIEFFNGNTGNGWDIINHKGIRQDVWAPYDGRAMPILPGELGVWISIINVFEYMIKHNVLSLLVFEDDVVLNDKFIERLNLCLGDLPESFDFLSLYYFLGQNNNDALVDIGSKYIQKSNNQFSAGQAIIYSLSGAKKILKLIKRKGIEYTSDCFIFKQAQEGFIDGYSIKMNNDFFVTHAYKDIKSLIDPTNIRNTPDL